MEARRKFDQQFKEGAVRIVRETGKPIAQVARDLGIHQGTLGRWVNGDRRAREGSDSYYVCRHARKRAGRPARHRRRTVQAGWVPA